MQNIKYKLPGFRGESSISSSISTSMTYTEENNFSSDHIIPAVCVPCCFSDPYCRNCDRKCRRFQGEGYYSCMDKCVPGGITWP
jgi:hypothetical protein